MSSCRATFKWKHWPWCAKQGWMPDHVADAILEEAGIDADKELQRAMDTVARYEKDFSARGVADG